MTPLRQFKGVPPDIVRRAEAKQFVSPLLLSILIPLTCLS